MPSPDLHNFLSSKDLDVTALVDPDRIKFYTESLAEQINKFRMRYAPQKRIIDLGRWISNITIETTVQGSSLLAVSVIDPAWTMFMRDKNGVCFIDVDDSGYLWPPVEVTFPSDISSATWRLCQCIPTTDLTQANVTLTFEDKVVSELREHYKAQVSFPEQTRIEFIQQLVRDANKGPAFPGDVDIRFVPLLPKEAFTTADLTMQQRLPASATQQSPPPARKNPNKHHKTTPVEPKPLTAAQVAAGVVDLSIEDGLAAFQAGMPHPRSPFAPVPPHSIGLPGGSLDG